MTLNGGCDLAGDVAAGVMAPTGLGVAKSVDTVDHRADLVLLDRAAQVFQIAAAPDHDRLERGLTVEHAHEVDRALGTCQDADQGDQPAKGDRLHRLRQSVGAPDLHHAIHAAPTGQRAHLATPIRRGAIVDYLICAQRPQPLRLVWT